MGIEKAPPNDAVQRRRSYGARMAERVGLSAAFESEGLRYWPVDFSSANGILAHRSGSATVAP